MSPLPQPSQEEVDDVLLSCRFGELAELRQFVDSFGPEAFVEGVKDERGTTGLHYICGNGHLGKFLGFALWGSRLEERGEVAGKSGWMARRCALLTSSTCRSVFPTCRTDPVFPSGPFRTGRLPLPAPLLSRVLRPKLERLDPTPLVFAQRPPRPLQSPCPRPKLAGRRADRHPERRGL